MISIEEFLALDFKQQKLIYQRDIENGNMYTMPFWAERLRTAIENKKPATLFILKSLNKFYLLYTNCK